jgi:hypothetical protein
MMISSEQNKKKEKLCGGEKRRALYSGWHSREREMYAFRMSSRWICPRA